MRRYFILLYLFFTMIYPAGGFIWGAGIDNSNQDGTHFRLIKLHYKNSSGEKGLTTFEYDDSGLMVKARWELLDGTRNSVNYYTYDEKANLIKKYRIFSDDITSTQVFQYDINENLLSEQFTRSDSVSGLTTYHYNDQGKLIEANCRGLNGWFFGKIKYRYDEKGNEIEATLEKDGKNIGTINYHYNDQGNLFQEIWQFSSGWSQTFINEYEKYEN